MARKMKKRRTEKVVNTMMNNLERGFKKITKEINKR